MVRYLKYIVLVFGGLGLMIGGFFFLQNKHDLATAWEYSSRIDTRFLKQQCRQSPSVIPCLELEFADFAKQASLTGMSIGMKMAFNVIDDEKYKEEIFSNKAYKNVFYSMAHLKINNLALDQVYRNYYGFDVFYPGYIGSLPRFYEEGFEFSENLIHGLQGPEGIEAIKDEALRSAVETDFKLVEERYFSIKNTVNEYIERETNRLEQLAQ